MKIEKKQFAKNYFILLNSMIREKERKRVKGVWNISIRVYSAKLMQKKLDMQQPEEAY